MESSPPQVSKIDPILSSEENFYFYDFFSLFFVLCCQISVISLVLSEFSVPLVLGSSAFFTVLTLVLFWKNTHKKLVQPNYTLISILLIAWLFRKDIYPHIMGGADPGLYVNMAAVFLREKSLYFVDSFRTILPQSLLPLYDAPHHPSVSFTDASQSVMTIEFYPLHSLIMAISMGIFGPWLHTLIMFLYTIMYLIGSYRLSQLIFKDNQAAHIAVLLMAINPALAFFSKFPVTEMLALALSVNGFYFFLRSLQSTKPRIQLLSLGLAVAYFNAMFYTRPQFFMYIPLFGMIFVASLLPLGTLRQKRLTQFFVSASFLLFALSLAYYHKYQIALFTGIYGHLSSLVTPSVIKLVAAIVLLFAIIAWFYARKKSNTVNLATRLVQLSEQLLSFSPYLLSLALLASFWSLYRFYLNPSLFPFPWDLPKNEDNLLFRYHVLFRYMMMLSPPSFILIAASCLFKIKWPRMVQWLYLFLTICWSVILLQPVTPFLYYYGRYLCSEMLPYSIILIGGLLSWTLKTKYRRAFQVLFVSILGYSLYFTGVQFGKIESDEVNPHKVLIDKFPSNSIFLMLYNETGSRLITPFRIYDQLRVFFFLSPQEMKANWVEFGTAMKDILRKNNAPLILAFAHPVTNSYLKSEGHLDFVERFFSNSEHLRAGQIYTPHRLEPLLLPFRNESNTLTLHFYSVETQKVDELFTTVPTFLLDYQ